MNPVFDLTSQNLNEALSASQERAMVFCFYAPSHAESQQFVNELEKIIEQYALQYPNAISLAKVNCEAEAMLAAQFRIQALPTTYLFKDGSPLDAFLGVLAETELRQRLAVILPKEDEIKFNQALDHLAEDNYDAALPLLKEAWELSDKKNSDIALLYAETYIAMHKTEPAQEILKQIPLQDRDSRWQGLQAQIDLLLQAADTPEIQQLQQEYSKNPSADIAVKLANQLHQAHRNEEALSLLFAILRQDLAAQNGEVKQQFLAILAAIGNHDPITNKYRRLLYSILY